MLRLATKLRPSVLSSRGRVLDENVECVYLKRVLRAKSQIPMYSPMLQMQEPMALPSALPVSPTPRPTLITPLRPSTAPGSAER